MADADTFPKLLQLKASQLADHPAIREKDYGIWQTWTWADYLKEVTRFAAGLSAMGFERGDKLFIIGQNRPRMYFAVSAAQCLGGVPVPTYYDAVAEEMKFVIGHAEAKFVIAEDQEQVDKVIEIRESCPTVTAVIYDDDRGLADYDKDFIRSFESVQALGDKALAADPELINRSIQASNGADVSVILYTSGTTGQPKGVVLTYDNIRSIASICVDLEGLNETDSVIAYLPMAWIVDHFISYAQAHIAGFCVCCPESPETVMADSREIGPTYHFTSPRVLENHRTSIMIRMEDASKLKRWMFHKSLDVAKRCLDAKLEGKPIGLFDQLMYKLGKLTVYEPLKNQLGYSRTRLTYTAGEAIGPDMFDFYRSIGIHIKQVYGQTEASPFVTVQPDDQIRSDTVGKPIKDVEIRLSDDGEVLFRSPGVFHSYYKNPEATRSAKTEDGWVHTGDAGIFDSEGHLKIIDRTKDVGRLNNGAMFAPKYIENKLKFFQYILEAITFGDARDEVTAMINIDLSAVGDWAERRGLSYGSYQELAAHPEVYKLIEECIEQVNADLAADELLADSQVRRFLILHKELDADDGELTRTRKLRRRIIAERYKTLIDALYDGSDHCEISVEVTFEDGRKGSLNGDIRIVSVRVFNTLAKTA
ncbi:MAG: AMP-binding protein [marine bacterium B5-7]|nr:MAG: AMP-binding protein [marine bacterium B5-7]